MDAIPQTEAGPDAEADGISAMPLPPKRRGGRAPGVKNKVGREARDVLGKYAGTAWERLCRGSLGMPVYNHPEARGGVRTKRIWSDAEQMAGLKIIAERTVASLKSIEATGADGAPLLPGTVNYREAAKSILEVFGKAGTPTPLPAAMGPATASTEAGGGGTGGQRFETPLSPSRDPGRPDLPHCENSKIDLDGRAVIAAINGRFAICRRGDATPLEWRPTREQAESRARELLETHAHLFPR